MKQVIYLLLILVFLLSSVFYFFPIFIDTSPDHVFDTLSEAQKYADTLDEYPPIDNTTWANPDYSKFLERLVPTGLDESMYIFKIKSWPLWHIQGFDKLLSKVVKERENDGYIGRFILKMNPLKGSSFIIWGDLQGAFHSLIRTLVELKKNNVINDDFEIMKPYVYFVFNGDAVDRSPFSLEVLSVIMRLMDRNPNKVFYIRGNHEDREHWKNFNLKRDLIIRGASVSNEEVPLGAKISKLFNTLPLALYLIGQEDKENINIVRISHFDRSSTELNEENFSGFFQRADKKEVTIFKLSNEMDLSEKKINVRAIIRGESRSTIYRPTLGLSQLEADKGATAWTMLSSPTEAYRHLQDFYFDAFAVLDIGKTLNEWMITLYNQDVRELLGFKKVAMYNLVTGLRDFKAEKTQIIDDSFVQVKKKLQDVAQEIQELQDTCPVVIEYDAKDEAALSIKK
jgi:hypothetical protein